MGFVPSLTPFFYSPRRSSSLLNAFAANHVAYTMAKYGMSMCVLGMAEEFRDQGSHLVL